MNEHLILAIKAAIDAGQKIMKVYDTDFAVDYKKDESPLTLADKEANQSIVQLLNSTGLPIISEELDVLPFTERKKWSKLWMVDPLDGTKEFVKKNDEFTVNIALIENGIPVLGVVYVPVKKTLYYGSQKGAFLMENVATFLDYTEELAIPLQPKQFNGNVTVVASRSHINKETEQYIARLQGHKSVLNVKTISAGSSIKFCLVASGLADCYPRFSPTMEWDTAAGDAICRAAGILVTQEETEEVLLYNKENLKNPDFVVNANFYDSAEIDEV